MKQDEPKKQWIVIPVVARLWLGVLGLLLVAYAPWNWVKIAGGVLTFLALASLFAAIPLDIVYGRENQDISRRTLWQMRLMYAALFAFVVLVIVHNVYKPDYALFSLEYYRMGKE